MYERILHDRLRFPDVVPMIARQWLEVSGGRECNPLRDDLRQTPARRTFCPVTGATAPVICSLLLSSSLFWLSVALLSLFARSLSLFALSLSLFSLLLSVERVSYPPNEDDQSDFGMCPCSLPLLWADLLPLGLAFPFQSAVAARTRSRRAPRQWPDGRGRSQST